MIRLLFVLSCFISLKVSAQDSIPAFSGGHLRSQLNNETSGIAASFINRHLLYIHNDSGDSSRIFLVDTAGNLKAIYSFNGVSGTKLGVVDCEDIATGIGPLPGRHYIYLGDIGDNLAVRKYITVYRAEEPAVLSSGKIITGHIKVTPLHLKYPDGARDAETLMVDPYDSLLYIISKREDSVRVYTAPLSFQAEDTVILTKRCVLYFEGIFLAKQITGGDISQDGKQVLIKSYSKVYYWKRKNKEPIWKLLMTTPRILPYRIEKQGEAIGFNKTGTIYYTTSEGLYQPLYYYRIIR